MLLRPRSSRLLAIALVGAAITLTSACGKKAKANDVKGNFPATNKAAQTSGSGTQKGVNGQGWSADGGAPDAATLEGSGSSSANRMGSGSSAGAAATDASGSFSEAARGEMGELGEAIDELPNILFQLDKSDLSDEAKATLDSNAAYLLGNEPLFVILRGHTDDSGTEEYNRALGSKRAQAVRDYLVEKGIDSARLETISFGEDMPLAQGEDEAIRSQNRRVEFFVYTK